MAADPLKMAQWEIEMLQSTRATLYGYLQDVLEHIARALDLPTVRDDGRQVINTRLVTDILVKLGRPVEEGETLARKVYRDEPVSEHETLLRLLDVVEDPASPFELGQPERP